MWCEVSHIWCCPQLVPRALQVRGGKRARYGSANPLAFMDLQDVQELSNFFERRVSAYQVVVTGEVSFDDDF
jgi:ribonucleoside-diphosphate reductase beta chain